MSQENVEIVRRLYDALARGDTATVLALFDPQVVVVNFAGAPETRPYVGHDGLGEWAQSTRDAMGDFRIEADEMLDVDENRVVVVGRVFGRGPTSGLPVEVHLSTVITLRGGKIVRTHSYRTKADALEAVGLRE